MTTVYFSHPVPWEDFIKQLDTEEIEFYFKIRFMAQELDEPQKITLYGIPFLIMWQSGAVQRIREVEQDLTLQEFVEGWSNP